LVLKIFDGIDFDEANDSVDIIYSNQVFEHLHPEDALLHVQQYFKFLKKGGKVVIITPHCLTGPHDISRNYSNKPEGFHMKEYNYKELKNILLNVGFSHPKLYIGNKKYGYYFFPNSIFIFLEKIYNKVPLNTRYKLKNNPVLFNFFRLKIVIANKLTAFFMKILHIIFSFTPDGAETMLVDIINEQSKTDEVELIIINNLYNKELIKTINTKASVFCLDRKVGSINPFKLIKLNSRIFRYKPDVIHFHSHNAIGLLLKRRTVVTFLTIHGLNRPL